ncbi:hypothetical protein NECID01_1237 [Nematocida sp. AWRm77]|nr:hypothetical protein NECID01_1237 [Nematocida sp. AWRm77]
MEARTSLSLNASAEVPSTKKKKLAVLERIPAVVFGVLLYFMDALTLGGMGLCSTPTSPELTYISRTFFVLGVAVSQTVFYCCSSFTMGVMSSPITEAFLMFQSLSAKLEAKGLSAEQHFATLVACIGISTCMTGCMYMCLYVMGAQKILKRIPSEIGTSLFFTIGWLCVKMSNKTLWGIKDLSVVYTVLFNAMGLGLWMLSKYLSKKVPAVERYAYMIIVGCLMCGFYAWVWVSGASIDGLVKKGILSETQSYSSLKSSWISDLRLSSVQLGCIPGVLLQLVNISLLNMVHFPINLAAIEKGCGIKPSMKKELLAHGVSNFAACLVGGFPTYIISSSTIALNTPIRAYKTDTLIIAGCVLALYFLGQSVIACIPRPCVDMLLFFVGVDIIVDAGMEIVCSGWFLTIFCGAIATVCVLTDAIEIGMIIGVCTLGAKKMYTHFTSKKQEIETSFSTSVLPIRE